MQKPYGKQGADADLESSPELVDDKASKCLALNILSNHNQRPGHLGAVVQELENLLEGGNLAVHKQHKRILELALLGLGIVDEVGRDVSVISSELAVNLLTFQDTHEV